MVLQSLQVRTWGTHGSSNLPRSQLPSSAEVDQQNNTLNDVSKSQYMSLPAGGASGHHQAPSDFHVEPVANHHL